MTPAWVFNPTMRVKPQRCLWICPRPERNALMNQNRILLAASAMLLLALAGCGEEQAAVQDSEPPAVEQEAAPGDTARLDA